MNWKLIALWSGVAFVWAVTIGCWFLSAYLGRGYQEWNQWWAGASWICVNALLAIGALAITIIAAVITESSK